MNRSELPGEDEQFEAYRKVVQALKGRPVTIRTIDIGADKTLNSGPAPAASTANPALGRRAIRYSLAHPEVFLAQLRAILRASACGPVRLLVPMIAHHHEVDSLMTLLARGPDSHRLTPQEQQRWWQFSNDLLAWNGTTVFTTHVLTLGRRLLPAQL